jgi:N-acetylglucosaminyl-diphospho-decaprenol L-rhamnosyltransferase
LDLSIIIVNWNSRDYLEKCLASIEACPPDLEFEVIVIDSASYDGSDQLIKTRFPWVRFFQSHENLGFARSNNLGYEMAAGDNILFLNPDTEVVGTALQTLYENLTQTPGAGIVGARLLNSDGSIQTWAVQAFPTVLNQVFDSEVLRGWFPNSSLWGNRAVYESEARINVDVVSGACLMVKRSVFEAVGLFGSEYFMYSDDVDLCYQVRKGGWTNYHIPAAIVVHHGGGSSQQKESGFSSVMFLESRSRFFSKTRSGWYPAAYRLAIGLAAMVRIAVISAALPLSRGKAGLESAKGSLSNWRVRVRWALGLEGWVKSY